MEDDPYASLPSAQPAAQDDDPYASLPEVASGGTKMFNERIPPDVNFRPQLDQPSASQYANDQNPATPHPMTTEESRDPLKTVTSTPFRALSMALGAPGDIEHYAGMAAEAIAPMLGIKPEDATTPQLAPTSDVVQERIRSRIPQPMAKDWLAHEPTTTGGRIAGGALDMVTPIPGLSKEKAVERGVETVKDIVRPGARAAEREAAVAAAAPEIATLDKEVKAAYDQAHALGVQYEPKFYSEWLNTLQNDLKHYSTTPKVQDFIDRLTEAGNRAKVGGPVSVGQVEDFRKEAQALWANPDVKGSSKGAVQAVRSALDTFMEAAPTVEGTAPEAAKAFEKARELAKRQIRSRNIREIGEWAADTATNPGEYRQKVYAEIGKILNKRNYRSFKTYTPAQQEAVKGIRAASAPETGRNVGRFVATQLAAQPIASLAHALGPGAGAVANSATAVGGYKLAEFLRGRRLLKQQENAGRAIDYAQNLVRIRPQDIPAEIARGRLTTADLVRALAGGAISADMNAQ